MENLFERLKENRDSDIYPYHMPGHKRRPCGNLGQDLCGLDITEINGFDNLHQPTEILARLSRQAARLYGADESFYLINGSTAGILAAVSAALPQGGHILMARNCHKSAYHAAYLRKLQITYLFPPLLADYDIFDAVTPEQVREALENDPKIEAVLLVSPTYEGRISNIREIAKIVHQKDIPLIVDEAHGAHLGFGKDFAENSCRLGADLVIHSIHKTLPSLTQTALLHVSGERINRECLRRFLQIYQTSSPSYILMASIANALQFVEQEGEKAFGDFADAYETMTQKLDACKHLRLLPWQRQQNLSGGIQDIGKLVIFTKRTNLTGRKLYDILLNRYGLQTEMASEDYVLAMFTVNDGPEGYERMTRALLEIDRELDATGSLTERYNPDTATMLRQRPVCVLPLAEAWDREKELVELTECVGSCVGEFVNLYPPGVPILVPGEQMTEELCVRIQDWVSNGLTVQGVEDLSGKLYVKTLKDVSS